MGIRQDCGTHASDNLVVFVYLAYWGESSLKLSLNPRAIAPDFALFAG